LVSEINRAFPDFLKRDGYSSISEAIGTYSWYCWSWNALWYTI